jgi:hypothetical protein
VQHFPVGLLLGLQLHPHYTIRKHQEVSREHVLQILKQHYILQEFAIHRLEQ